MTENNTQSTFEFCSPCTGRIRLVAHVEHDELQRLFDALEANVVGLPYFLLELDMVDIESTAPEARRLTAERLGRWQRHALAVVTGSFAGRMIAKLVLTANERVNHGRTKSAFFDDLEPARAWLEQCGEDLKTQHS